MQTVILGNRIITQRGHAAVISRHDALVHSSLTEGRTFPLPLSIVHRQELVRRRSLEWQASIAQGYSWPEGQTHQGTKSPGGALVGKGVREGEKLGWHI